MTAPVVSQERLAELRQVYHSELYESVLPFWLKNSLDQKNGGYYNCLDQDGTVYDRRKHVWLQGRQVWMMARIHRDLHGIGGSSEYLKASKLGLDFLRKFARSGDRVFFSLLEGGSPHFMQRKMFSECFYVMALAEYSRASGDPEPRKEAEEVFQLILKYAKDPSLLGRPVYDHLPATSELAIPMILLNLIEELNGPEGSDYGDVSEWCVAQIDKHYRPEMKLVLETVGSDGTPLDTIEGRLINPGHAIECGWFLMNYANRIGNKELREKSLNMIDWSFDYGWDDEFGGIYYFLDRGGFNPIQLEWNMKLWWPHCEALVAFIMAFEETGDARYFEQFLKVHEYSFKHFADHKHGEWFGYLDRRGDVSQRFKGGPYKGCFHVPRALFLVEKVLARLTQR